MCTAAVVTTLRAAGMAGSPPRRVRITIVEVNEPGVNVLDLLRELGISTPSEHYYYERLQVGDNYYTGQAGAVGPSAKSEGNVFYQTGSQTFDDIDLVKLATELATLRVALKKELDGVDSTAEQDHEIGEVARAELAAKAGDRPGIRMHLRQAGRRALTVAKSIGVEVAALAIAHSITG
jgi:hypothetical protein